MTTYFAERQMGSSGWCVFERKNDRTVLYGRYDTEIAAVFVADRQNELDRLTRNGHPDVVPTIDPMTEEQANAARVADEIQALLEDDIGVPEDREENLGTGLAQTQMILDRYGREHAMVPDGLQPIEDALVRAEQADAVAQNEADGECYYVDHDTDCDVRRRWRVIHQNVTGHLQIHSSFKNRSEANIVADANNEALRIEKRAEAHRDPIALRIEKCVEAHRDPIALAKAIDKIDSPAKHAVAERKEQTKDQIISELRKSLENSVNVATSQTAYVALAMGSKKKMDATIAELKKDLTKVTKLIEKLGIREKEFNDLVAQAIKDVDEAEALSGEVDVSLMIDPPNGGEGAK